MTVISNSLIEELQKIKKTFIWHSSRPKISHKTPCNNFENGALKYVDISSKIISLQCSWLRKFCDENFHEWKIIPSHLIIIISSSSSTFPELPSYIMSNFLWFNKHILTEKKSIFFRYFSDKGLSFVYQLFYDDGNVKSWSSIKE